MAGILCTLTSCNAYRFLKEGDSLVTKTKLVFKNEKTVRDKSSLERDLGTFIEAKPNSNLLFFIPKEYLFLANSGESKNKRINRGIRGLGEPPVLYDEAACKKFVENMENYLRFKKGYYDARVDFIVEEKKAGKYGQSSGKQAFNSEISYIVSTGERYKVRSITYESQDSALLKHVEAIQDASFVKKSDYIDFTQFELEKSRLTIELQNMGYANFANSYIEISGDSSEVTRDIAVEFQIRTPVNENMHTQFRTGTVRVFTDYFKNQSVDSLIADSLGSILFYRQSQKHLVKPSLLSNSIFFRKEKLLSREDRQKTFRKLNSLGTYSFVTVNAFTDPLADSLMNFDIQLTPHAKKWIYDGGLQGYFSTLGAARLFGFSLSSQFINRNLLGGSEKYSLRAEIGTELGKDQELGFVRRTTNLSLQNNLNIPSFQDFAGLGKLAWRTGVIKDRFYRNFVEEASTNIGLGFNTANIINFYSLTSWNASFGFDYTSPRGNRYVFRPLGFNLDLYEVKDTTRFQQNPLILLSFKDILGTGFLFRDFSYIYNKPKNKRGISFLAINNLEVSGWELHFLNKLYNQLGNREGDWSLDLGRKIDVAKYVRYEFDGRLIKEYNKTTSFAARVNAGIIVPFGSTEAAPFIKQFGVGGPNSLRAWNIKEPGPGGYRDPLTKLKSIPAIFVNQGDIKLELNAEFRFKIFLILDGAFFVDAGNVWTLRNDPNRPDAAISTSFLNQMAIAAGYGLRFNFDFFIIRFDFGYKVRSPFEDPYKKSRWYTFREIREQGIGNIQVAVNYPF